VIEEPKDLPDVILPPTFRRGLRDIEPTGIGLTVNEFGRPTIFTENGELLDPDTFLDWLVGKEAYTVVENRGVFDSIFKCLPPKKTIELSRFGETNLGSLSVRVYGRDGNLVVRRGNVWGRLSNILKISPDLQTPKHYRLAVELSLLKLSRYGFPEIPIRSVGQVVQDAVFSHSKIQPRPPDIHLYRFLQSFKGARMEGVIFGRSEVYDYDITSAYPSFASDLVSTIDMTWVDTTQIIEDANYAAIRCDVEIKGSVVRGPIAVRYGQRSIYFPVGLLSGVWLSKPDIDLLLEYPQVGKILKVHEGSWGITRSDTMPFRRVLRQLYSIRRNDEFLSGFMKFSMAALWGKFISAYNVVTPDNSYVQASALYNPVFASHVTSQMRCSLFRKSMGREIVGEFVDGLTVSREIPQVAGFGGFQEQGRGEMVLFSDQFKGSTWKNTELLALAEQQKDSPYLDLPMNFRHSLESSYRFGGPQGSHSLLSRETSSMQRIRLGSSMRFLDQDVRVGDFLEGSFSSYPPGFSEIRALRFLKAIEMEAT